MNVHNDSPSEKAYSELEQSMLTALETYSNVHRGSGHYSIVTTGLFEKAREIVCEYLEIKKGSHAVIFCTSRGEALMLDHFKPGDYRRIKSSTIGLPLGITAIAIKRRLLKKPVPFLSGGGTAKLIASGWVVWEKGHRRYEAGTPSIINIIAFSRALQLTKKYGNEIFLQSKGCKIPETDLVMEDELIGFSGY